MPLDGTQMTEQDQIEIVKHSFAYYDSIIYK